MGIPKGTKESFILKRYFSYVVVRMALLSYAGFNKAGQATNPRAFISEMPMQGNTCVRLSPSPGGTGDGVLK